MKIRKFSSTVLASLILLMIFSSMAIAGGGFIYESGKGQIDWGSGTASGSSSIVPMQDSIDPHRTKALAVRQAGVQARRNLLSAILNTSIDGRKTVRSNLEDDYKLSVELRGFVQNSLLETQVDDEGVVEVKASLSLRGKFSSVLYPSSVPFLSGIAPSLNFANNSTLENGLFSPDVDALGAIYSGIIIDARSVAVTPALLPVIYDSDGIGVYGAFLVSRSNVLSKGLVGYYTDSSSTDVFTRVGSNPVTVKLIRKPVNGGTGFILSREDSLKVRQALKNELITSNCAVAVLVTAPAEENNNVSDVEVKETGVDNSGTGSSVQPSVDSNIIEEPLVQENKPE
jgi:hypothetical protein